MAVTLLSGFEAQDLTADGFTLTGTAGYSTAIKRTGAASMRCNPASGAQGKVQAATNDSTGNYQHFGLYVATLPSVARSIYRTLLFLNSNGTLTLKDDSAATIGTSSIALSTGQWYWIGVRHLTGTSVVWLQIDDVNAISGTGTVGAGQQNYGCDGVEASAIDLYFDDIVDDSAGFLASSKVALLLPISDNAVGTGWTLGTGTAISSNGWSSVDNTPPVGVANVEAGSDPKQIRNASANANVNYDANLTTYSTAGVGASDTVLAVQQIVATAAPVSTSAKQGTFGISSNPVIANVALAAGGVSGAFWSGVAEGNYATGWKLSFGAVTASPSVTVGSSPVARITQVTSSTRIATVCFMGLYMAWTPAAVVAGQVPYTSPMPQLLAQ
jgi:hypothetical protein